MYNIIATMPNSWYIGHRVDCNHVLVSVLVLVNTLNNGSYLILEVSVKFGICVALPLSILNWIL